jgi:mono/diheme cytochrome c family protein
VSSCAVVGQTRRVTKSELRVVPGFVAVRISVMLILAAAVGIATDANAVGSYYTEAQAQAGQAVFRVQCAICHGDTLEGKAGPALAGAQFLSVSQYQQLNADYLYRFMSKHMPANAPGSLSEAQYLDALAYILKVNGYPSGAEPLIADDKRLAQIKIEPTGTSQPSKP